MGLDVSTGVMVGINLWKDDFLEDFSKEEVITQYNTHTGEPYELLVWVGWVRFKKELLGHHIGEEVTTDSFLEELKALQSKLGYQRFEYNPDCLGSIGIIAESHWFGTSDDSFELPPSEKIKAAIELWVENFQNIEPKILIYTHFSY
jgi:hypothetical protein